MAPGAAHRNKVAPGFVDQRTIDVILRRHVQSGETTKAFFVFIDAPHFLAWFQNFGDRAKIEVAAPARFCPLQAAILQEIGRLQVALAVGRGATHIPTPITKAYEHLVTDGLSFMLGAAYVLSPGHFKVGKQFFGAGTNIQHPAAPTMHGRRVDLKAERAVRCQPFIYSRVIVSYIWFQAQDYRPLFASKYVGLFKQSAQRW